MLLEETIFEPSMTSKLFILLLLKILINSYRDLINIHVKLTDCWRMKK